MNHLMNPSSRITGIRTFFWSHHRWLAASLFVILASCSIVASSAGTSRLSLPEPFFCSVEPADDLGGLFLVPSEAPPPASQILVTVRNGSNNIIPDAVVSVTLTERNVVCGSTILSGVTNSAGQVTLLLKGGGCAHQIPLSGLIKANGLTIRAYENVKSPDTNGDLKVDIRDLVMFSREFLEADPAECHDYNNDGVTGLPELVLFGGVFTSAVSCSP